MGSKDILVHNAAVLGTGDDIGRTKERREQRAREKQSQSQRKFELVHTQIFGP